MPKSRLLRPIITNSPINMKARKILTALVTLPILASCSNNSLRSDIKDFIASFSLDESIKAYLEAGYIETKVAVDSIGETKTITNFTFNVKDATHPKYKKVISTYFNNELSEEISEEIIEENNAFYFVKTGQENVIYSLGQVHSLVEQYFYKEIQLETIHLYGMYYGDYIKQIVTTLQSLVTIDQEKELYCYSAERSFLNDKNIKVYEKQDYQVNALGMLVNNDLIRSTDSLTVTTHIETYKI